MDWPESLGEMPEAVREYKRASAHPMLHVGELTHPERGTLQVVLKSVADAAIAALVGKLQHFAAENENMAGLLKSYRDDYVPRFVEDALKQRAEQAEAEVARLSAKLAASLAMRAAGETISGQVHEVAEFAFDDVERKERYIEDLQDSVEKAERALDFERDLRKDAIKRIEVVEAEVEKLRWMVEHICERASVGTMYAPMPWVSKDKMLADLERRWEEHRGKI